MHSVEANNLKKKYGKNIALRGVSFTADAGEIFGIVGPDGAGKTSIFRILTTLILPDEGSGTILGMNIIKDYKKIRRRLGYMPGKFSLYQDLSVEENLKFFATLFGTTIKENYYLVKDIYSNLEPFKKRKAGALSGGMKQKLALCCALIHKPDVLFLDEPTTGVDPVSRKEFWGMLTKLKDQGLTIIVSTPYMDEAKLCDMIALIRHGQFLDTDTPDNIISKFEHPLLAVHGSNMPALLRAIRGIPEVFSCYAFGDKHHVTMNDKTLSDEESKEIIKNSLYKKGFNDLSITSINPDIEDCYMYLDTIESKK